MTMSPQSTAPAPSQRCHLQQVWLLLACALVPLACATPKREKLRLEAYSWWTQPSERRAFDAVLDIYNQAHDDSEAVNEVTGEISADAVRATLTARLLADAPPSTFQANAGADLLRWTAMDTTQSILTSSSRIASIQGLFERSGLDHALPEELKRALQAGPSLNGLPYAVPLNIHRLNLIYYNRSALDNYVARTGQSFLEPAVLCPPDVDHATRRS